MSSPDTRWPRRPRNDRGPASGAVWALSLTTVATLACGVGPSYGPPAPALTGPEELADLHDAVRVPGLDDRRFDHATYWHAVSPYLGGGVAHRVAGESAEGRTIRHLTFGDGPETVLLWSQMHGNESTASMALADVIRLLHDRPHHPLVRRIAEGATIHMIPMLNPDGAERFQRRNAQGIDVNRDRKSTRLNSSHVRTSRMPSSA